MLSTDPSAPERIKSYCLCARCVQERPPGVSHRDWASIRVGLTEDGLRVWCNRHEMEALHLKVGDQIWRDLT